MQVLRLVVFFGLVLPWAIQLAGAQDHAISPGRCGERFERYVATNDALKEALKETDPKPAKKERVHPVRWDFEALEGRFHVTRLVMLEREAILICVAKVEG